MEMLMKSFKDFIKEDGMAVGGSTGPTNVSSGVAGTGGSAGEPGVNPKKRKSPVLMKIAKRNPPKM
jgi:hypothetical protein